MSGFLETTHSCDSMSLESKKTKSFFLKTYGCQMNVYDSQRISDLLKEEGYVLTEHIQEADLVLLNTCHIREKAVEKVYSDLGRIRKLMKQEKETLVGVAGCVAQAEGEEIIRRTPMVDFIIGPQVLHRLSNVLRRAYKGERVIELDHVAEAKFDHFPKAPKKEIQRRGVAAFLTVQEGCDKFCSFCVVPYTRGEEVSRPALAIIHEAEHLVSCGVREITLLGQNVNAWKAEGLDRKEWGLGHLLFRLAEIPGLLRLRYTTSHPADMDSFLIAAHRDLPILMPYLHLPIQSGSDRILKAMNRRYTKEEYKKIIEKIRLVRPDIAISGDFIVGFPGERDEDFDATMQLIRDVEYASGFSFKYSPRPGTPAAEMEDTLPLAVKDARLQELQALLTEQRARFFHQFVGKKIEVLIEKKGREPHQILGRSPWLQSVVMHEKYGKMGDICEVLIQKADTYSLYGEC